MKVSAKYFRILETYLEWESVRTPASGSFQESRKSPVDISEREDGLSAAEALCTWESTGVPCFVRPSEWKLLRRYIQGKSQRDWWSKEIGWWNKNAAFIPEEFLGYLGPIPFIELFSRAPITRIVRYYYDNSYRLWEFKLDGMMKSKESEWNMIYFERDDRQSALRNTWRMAWIKWIDPAIYRTKRKLTPNRG